MLRVIDTYEQGEIGLATLTSSLEALLRCLEDPPEYWVQSFESEWSVLEQVYATASDQKITKLDMQSRGFVSEAILGLRKLIPSVDK